MRPARGVPGWLYLPALVGFALVVIPPIALTQRLPWRDFWSSITSESSLQALELSLRTAVISTVLCLSIGVPMAIVFARSDGVALRVVRALVLLPLVLPPVVGGIALLYAFGRRGLIGEHLTVLGVDIAFSTTAVVLAQTFVALPFLVISVEGALRVSGSSYEQVAATLGAGPTRTLVRVTIPLVAPALLSGLVLAFARAMGEFGATITFAGNAPGVTQTAPLKIYVDEINDPQQALPLSFVLIVVALVVVVAVHLRRPGRQPVL
ncbi:MAG: molybdate ABC transporter permease subunit [Williamsia herbipolensis]|nr:molybdate ABC transporter permease subunit [Williamsia herbipolensis]